MLQSDSSKNDNHIIDLAEKRAERLLSLAPAVVKAMSVHLNKAKLKLKVGQEAELYSVVLPLHASDKRVVWTSNNPDIAAVSSDVHTAVIQGVSPGRAIIIVTTEDGKFCDVCVVTVHPYLTHK